METILDCIKKRAWRSAWLAFMYWAGLQLRTTLAFLALAYLAGFAFYFGASKALSLDLALFDRANLVRVFHIENTSGGDHDH